MTQTADTSTPIYIVSYGGLMVGSGPTRDAALEDAAEHGLEPEDMDDVRVAIASLQVAYIVYSGGDPGPISVRNGRMVLAEAVAS